jgi:nucleoside phosphorylase
MSESRGATAALTTLVGLAFLLVQLVLFFGTSFGVVHEYCFDEAASRATNSVQVDSSWTYILWPPLFLANTDPAGRCVRNSPLREGLGAIGVWDLPSPEQQVKDHLESQAAK